MSTPSDEIDRALEGKVVAVPETRQIDLLANLLERRGATVLRCPLVGIEDSQDEPAVVGWLDRLISTPTSLVVFYTGEGVQRLAGFAQRAARAAAFMEALARTPKLTRGPKPKRALKKLGLDAEYAAAEPTTAGMIETATSIEAPLERIAVQLYSQDQDRQLVDHFLARGADVDTVAPYTYASAADDERVTTLLEAMAAGGVDAIAFTSKSQVQRLIALARKRRLDALLEAALAKTKVAAVGPVVAAELAGAGIRVAAVPKESYSMKPLVRSVCELLAGRR